MDHPIPPDDPLGHAGEIEMRARLPSPYRWSEDSLRAMMRPTISPALARFIEALPFFFIATSDGQGHCDCSFRGRDYALTGQPLPALLVLDETRLVFPDFSGNGLYNSLGNIRVNPQIGMLFMDFARQRRARINGRALLRLPNLAELEVWPAAQAIIEVRVEQAYGNCAARIPRMHMVEGSDAPFN